MEPKTRTKIGPKSGPQNAIRGPKFVRRRKQGCVEMIFIQRSAGRSDSIVQQTNNFNQRRKGNLGGQNCSNREHEYIHRPNMVKTCFTCRRYTVKSHAGENQQHPCCYGGTPMRHRKTACFEALVLEPHFAQSCGRFLLLYCILGWQTSLQRLKVSAHVLVKSWFAAPLPCTFQCFVRKVKNTHRKHFVLAPKPSLGFCAPSSVVSVASGWWVAAVDFVVACCLAATLLMWLLGVSWWVS